MHRSVPLALALLLSSSLASPAAAWTNPPRQTATHNYFEIAYVAVRAEEREFDLRANPTAARFTMGSRIFPNLAIEATAGTGAGSDRQTFMGEEYSVQVREFLMLSIRPFIAINERVEIYGRVGYFTGKGRVTGPGFAVSDTDDDVALGAGVAFGVGANTAIFGDYMQYYNRKDLRINGFAVGLRQAF
jgi:hypothetical protein